MVVKTRGVNVSCSISITQFRILPLLLVLVLFVDDFSQSETEKYFKWMTNNIYCINTREAPQIVPCMKQITHSSSMHPPMDILANDFFCIVTSILCRFTRLQILRLLECTQLCHETFWLLSAMRSSRPPWPGDHGSLNTALTGPFSRSTLNEVPNGLLRLSHLWVTTCMIR